MSHLFQKDVDNWMQTCFGPHVSADLLERCDRFIEEALELVQAAGYTEDRALALVEYVFGRPKGRFTQEVGGVMVTLSAMCNVLGIDYTEAGTIELARCWKRIDAIREKQKTKPHGSALPMS